MVRATERSVPLDQTDKKIGLPEPAVAGSLDIRKLLPGRFRDLFKGIVCVKVPDQKALRKARKSLLVKEGQYMQLIQKLYDTGIVEIFREKPEKSTGRSAYRRTAVESNDSFRMHGS